MLTIRPPCCSRMWGRARRASRVGPRTMVSNARRASSSPTSSMAPLAATPALLTRPYGLSSSITSSHRRASVTSSITVRTLTPASRAARETALALAVERTPPTTLKPRLASSTMVASPMPVPAPVTSTVLSTVAILGVPVKSVDFTGKDNLPSQRMKLWDPLAFREMTALLGDPVMRGRGVRRGDGRPVLLVPGFLSGDWSLRVLHNWLKRVGYESRLSGIQFNVQHSEHLVAGLRTRLIAIRKESGSRVSVVGHSRGGVLAKVLASREPDAVEQVIGLGAPFADQFDIAALTNVAVGVVRTANELRWGRSFASEGRFAHELRMPPAVPTTSIYTRSDDVVNFRSCLRPDITALPVWGSHNGLIVNPEVYRVLGRLLARPRRAP